MGESGGELMTEATVAADRQTPLRTWAICGLMLPATTLNYMDRQTLAQQAADIRGELRLSNEGYGWLETGFGSAFAVGSLVTGAIADRVNLCRLYPAIRRAVMVGFLTGWVNNYTELFLCRVLLGFFEAGQWPCVPAAAQRLLPRDQRPLGNSILQSGASLGEIVTPPIILLLNSGEPGGWRLPFQVVGGAGLIWIVVWLMAIQPATWTSRGLLRTVMPREPRRPSRTPAETPSAGFSRWSSWSFLSTCAGSISEPGCR